MKLSITILVILLFVPQARGQTIGVYADSMGMDCKLGFQIGVPRVVYVIGALEGPAADGIVNAFFRISGLPEGWTAEATPGPLVAVAQGNPFVEGTWMAFGSCVRERVKLLTLEITANSIIENGLLSVDLHSEYPAGCGFEGEHCGPCVRFCGCDTLYLPCYCARGVDSTVNGDFCTVAVEAHPWSRIKQLFR